MINFWSVYMCKTSNWRLNSFSAHHPQYFIIIFTSQELCMVFLMLYSINYCVLLSFGTSPFWPNSPGSPFWHQGNQETVPVLVKQPWQIVQTNSMNPHIMVNISYDNQNQIIHIFQGLYFTILEEQRYSILDFRTQEVMMTTMNCLADLML